MQSKSRSRLCKVEDCCSPAKTRGLCNRHYLQWWKRNRGNFEHATNKVDLTGKRFGRLVVTKEVGRNKSGNVNYECLCDCGNSVVVSSGHLRTGHTRSCGCLALDVRVKQLEKHGITTGGKPRTFIIWNGMKARCLNPKADSYPRYGARGIKICDEWLTFENFHNWAIENGYADDLQIDRIDNDGNYEPSNCRWVTPSENSSNTSRTHLVSMRGKTRTVTQWIKELGISRSTAYKYLRLGDDAFVAKFGGDL